MKKLTQKEFIIKLELHNTTYPHKKSFLCDDETYINNITRLEFYCTQGHYWETQPKTIINEHRGCPVCFGGVRLSSLMFKEKLKRRNQANPSNIVTLCDNQEYITINTKLMFTCVDEHTWMGTPKDIIHKNSGCPTCGRNAASSKTQLTEADLRQRITKRNEKYPHKKVYFNDILKYKNIHNKTEFVCDFKHTWLARPYDVLSQDGCPICKKRPYSHKAIQWLTSLNINIMHAENGGEFKITNTNYLADGYCRETNTIYEFNGNNFHGNPKLFNPNERCHPYDKRVTAQELFNRTKKREKEILDNGFNLIVMWEDEWDGMSND